MVNLASSLHKKIRLLKWLIPLALVLVVVAYEIGPSRWVYVRLGFTYHLVVEILLFGTVGPLLAFLVLELLYRWTTEKETAEFQANLLARAKEREVEGRRINDDTLQVLFATSLLLASFKADGPDLPSSTSAQIEVTEQFLSDAIRQVRSHLSGGKAVDGRMATAER